ncbi:unnamed protein product [Cuscuta campestris]|uniref:Tc1-like transposase DDE domain-containing protein n=1 Tax=Cuscuta campestris TaxID=132261 RepID=A0A484KF71_9ASTE|nr:unnamed protein product [Cuscuta campestris]
MGVAEMMGDPLGSRFGLMGWALDWAYFGLSIVGYLSRVLTGPGVVTRLTGLGPLACRPRFGDDGQVLWDGKIGIFPFTFQEAAKRTSKNRSAGTMKTKPIPKITRDVMREMMVQQLLPAIREKWPQSSKHVFIQQDNAKPHVDINDPVFVAAAQESDWDIKLQFQPPNSPDLNVLDLGFFRAIDAIQNKSAHRSLGDLINAVTTAFEQLTPQVLNNVFLTYQGVMGEVLRHKGGNNFKIPHMGKKRLSREGILPQNLGVSTEVYEEAYIYSFHASFFPDRDTPPLDLASFPSLTNSDHRPPQQAPATPSVPAKSSSDGKGDVARPVDV